MDECAVCFEELSSNDVLECKHKIHSDCIIKSCKAECPICRQHLSKFDGFVKKQSVEINYELGIMDILVAMGIVNYQDIPYLDDLKLENNFQILTAGLMLYLNRN